MLVALVKCEKCGQEVEVEDFINDGKNYDCTNCDGEAKVIMSTIHTEEVK